MPADKMPKMPEAVAWIHGDDLNEIHEGIERRDAPAFASPEDVDHEYREGMVAVYTADQMRAMYLAGIEAARSTVESAERYEATVGGGCECCGTWAEVEANKNGGLLNRAETLANLDALGRE